MNDDFKKAWEYYKHADTLLIARVNYSLVAQSMLIASFATLFAAEDQTSVMKNGEIGIAILGLFFAVIQWLLTVSLFSKMRYARKISRKR